MSIFVEVSTVFLDWTVLKGQKETIRCPVVFNEEIVVMFWLKMFQIDTKNDKNHEVFQIPKILNSFFPHFQQIFRIRTLKSVNKEKICCPVGFFEEIIAIL